MILQASHNPDPVDAPSWRRMCTFCARIALRTELYSNSGKGLGKLAIVTRQHFG
jgi:hypothetical protein